MLDAAGKSIFGAIDQGVQAGRGTQTEVSAAPPKRGGFARLFERLSPGQYRQ